MIDRRTGLLLFAGALACPMPAAPAQAQRDFVEQMLAVCFAGIACAAAAGQRPQPR